MKLRQWTYEAPFGPIAITMSDAGMVQVRFLVLSDYEDRPDAGINAAFDSYFGGDFAALNGVAVDRTGWADFRLLVLDELRKVDPGSLITYSELARRIGRPGVNRAVGQAVGSNPVPMIVPCHRVIASDGSLGGFSGGLEQKRWLLKHEGFNDLDGGWPSRRAMTAGV